MDDASSRPESDPPPKSRHSGLGHARTLQRGLLAASARVLAISERDPQSFGDKVFGFLKEEAPDLVEALDFVDPLNAARIVTFGRAGGSERSSVSQAALDRALVLHPTLAFDASQVATDDVAISHDGRLLGVMRLSSQEAERLRPSDHVALQQVAFALGAGWQRVAHVSEGPLAVLEDASAPIALLSATSVPHGNGALRELLGITSSDTALPLIYADVCAQVFAESARLGQTAEREWELPRVDGTKVVLFVGLLPIKNAAEVVTHLLVVARDTRARRELEREVQAAQRLATVGQLVAGVVHELNNPLTSISVYSEYLYDLRSSLDAPPGETEKLRRIVSATHRILRFTRQLVDYARPGADRFDHVDVRQVVETARGLCEHIASARDVRIVVDAPPDLPPVHGVVSELEQVFTNLVTNACHALGEAARREVVITLSGHMDGHVCVDVRDYGLGIDPERVGKIFDPFFSTKPKGAGTGLGLSIVRQIITRHRGTIEAASEPGRGTVFSISLPCLPPQRRAIATDSSRPPKLTR